METDVAPVLEIASTRVSCILREHLVTFVLLKATFKPGKSPEDFNSIYFPELIDVHHSPENLMKVMLST